MSGWIKLHRSLLDWEWFDDHNATRLLIFLLVSVNHEDKKWKGIDIKAGSMVFSWETLSQSIGLSIQQLRSAMRKLEISREVNRQSTNQFQIVTLVKWDKLQSERKKSTGNQQAIQQTDNKRITTTKEVKEDKEVKAGNLDFLKPYTKSVASFFGVDEINNFRTFATFTFFIERLHTTNRMEYFKTQFTAYQKITTDQKWKHSPAKFIGNPKENYEDGAWCAESYTDKITAETKPTAFDQMNRFLNAVGGDNKDAD